MIAKESAKKLNGLAFVSGPDKITVNATTGSNQTFTWKLNISQEHKERDLKAQFGPWNGTYEIVYPIITFEQKVSGNTTVSKSSENRLFRRLYWVGDLKRGYYISFQLVNIQRDDAGDYGVKLRVENYPRRPSTLQSWFTLKVEDPPPTPTPTPTPTLYVEAVRSARSIPVSSPTDTISPPQRSTGSPKSTTDDYYFGNVTIILVVIVGIISVLLGLLVIYAVLKWKKSRSGTVSNNKPDGESIALTSSVIADGHDNNELQMHVL
ncbi:hypothetical protein ABFA07_018249 [Porites harrisoni]